MRTKLTALLLATSLVPLVAACGDDGGSKGTAKITAWGEEAGTEGYPNDELSFADGWTVKYNHWVTSFGNIEFADQSEKVEFSDPTNYVGDWAKTVDPADVTTTDLSEGRHKFSFSFIAPTASATKVSDVDSGILTMMVTNHWNTYVDGTATKGGVTVNFKWGMTNPARYEYCVNGNDDTDGIAISSGQETEAGIFVHLDHLFWDKLGSEDADLRFDVLAGWKDASNNIPFNDLEGVSISALKDRAGNPILDDQGQPLTYDDAGLGYPKLKDYMVFSTSTQGHLNGEGLCTRKPL